MSSTSAVNVSVQDGMEFQELRAYMEGFAAGVQSAAAAASELRLNQVTRKASPATPVPPVTPASQEEPKE